MTQLLGPPSLAGHQITGSDSTTTTTIDPSPPEKKEQESSSSTTAMMGLTENCSPTFLTTGNPCLDFFFHILPDTPQTDLINRLNTAWSHDPITTLKLIAHLRGVRGTGKSDKKSFYTSALWLHENHPKTLALNVKWFAEFGYLKDLLEILFRLLEGDNNVREIVEKERKESGIYWVKGKRIERKVGVTVWRKGKRVREERSVFKPLKSRKKIDSKKDLPLEAEFEGLAVDEEEKVVIPVPKKKKKEELAKRALEKYNSDENYRFLHDKISELFGDLLSADVEYLKEKKYKKISLAAKWCPSLDLSYDRATLICESIAKRVFPREKCKEYEGVEEAHYAYRVRDRLRKEVLVPLRQALELPEVYMSSKKWGELPYERVASVAMKLYSKYFVEHDEERFTEHIENVKKGKAKIAAGALLPHEIVKSLNEYDDNGEPVSEQVIEVAELQWKRMVEDLLVKGKLNNCLAVCDVSGSMTGLPMEVCVALGILISELSERPWKGKLITFSADPTLQTVTGDTLKEKKQFVEAMDWGMSTDFQKVFDLILAVAIEGKLRESDMVKRVFVFSDMEFDQVSANDWETDYQAIQRKFKEKGYETAVPEIVFWNLRSSQSTPVAATQNGVALVSGYSKNLLNLFLEGDGSLNPVLIMESAIAGAEYEKLSVYD